MNIEGKRSGEGFVSDRQRLVGALLRAQSPRIEVLDLTLGRRGFLNYIRLLAGSNIIKVVPSANGSASEPQATDNKRLKVICGNHTGYLDNESWITQKSEFKRNFDICQVRVTPHDSVKPNLGATELAEALSRVIPFTAKEDIRPVLQCVHFCQKEGNLTLSASDGFRLAELSLDFDDGEGQALIPYDEIRGLIPALKKARRVRLGFEKGASLDTTDLIVDTEAISYKYSGHAGNYPNYDNILPNDFVAQARIDSREMLKAVSSLGALFLDRDTPIIITLKEGRIRLSVKDDRAEAYIDSQVEGEAETMISFNYLAQGLKALAGMAELKLTASPTSPVMFNAEGYRLVIMPIAPQGVKKAETSEVVTEAEKVVSEAAGKPEGEGVAEAIAEAEAAIAEGEAKEPEPEKETEPEQKPKRKKKKELVAVG